MVLFVFGDVYIEYQYGIECLHRISIWNGMSILYGNAYNVYMEYNNFIESSLVKIRSSREEILKAKFTC